MENTIDYVQAVEASYERIQDADIEQAILNTILIDNNLLPNISDQISEFDFAYEINQQIFSAMKKMYAEKIPIDILSLSQSVTFNNPAYIASLTDILPSSANWEFYVKQMLDISAFRKTDIVKNTTLADLTVHNIRERLEKASKEILEISIDSNSFKIKKSDEIMPGVIQEIQEAIAKPPGLSGYDWGLTELNKITDGIQNSFIIIGARPSMGKTALALKIISTCCSDNVPVGLFTLETTSKMIFNRLLAIHSHVQIQNLRSGILNEKQRVRVFEAAEKVNDWPLYILDDVYYLEDIKAKARYMVRGLGVKIIFIDYFSKIRARRKFNQRYEMFAEISSEIANLRKELNVPIVMFSQLRREAEEKTPKLNELKETGNLEQDGDLIIFLDQSREKKDEVNMVNLIVAKHKDGPTGIVKVGFRKSFAEFVNIEEEKSMRQEKKEKNEKSQMGFYDTMVQKEKGK